MQRASAARSRAASLSNSVSRFDGFGVCSAMSGDDKRLPETQFATQATDDLAMCDAELRGLDHLGVNVYRWAVGRARDRIEAAPDDILLSLFLVGRVASNLLFLTL